MLGKISTPYSTFSALKPTLVNAHGSLTPLGSPHRADTWTWLVSFAWALTAHFCWIPAIQQQPPPQELQPKRKRNKKEEAKFPEVSSPRGRPNRSSAAMWESGCLLIALRCPRTKQRAVLSSISETVQNSSHSQHVPVMLDEEFALSRTTSTMTDCFTADPETVSAQFEPSETACCFLPQVWQQWRERKTTDTDRYTRGHTCQETEGPGPP